MSLLVTWLPVIVVPGPGKKSSTPADCVSAIGLGPHETWLHSFAVTVLLATVPVAPLLIWIPFCAIIVCGPAPVVVELWLLPVAPLLVTTTAFFWESEGCQ